jgi:hypothetical protein
MNENTGPTKKSRALKALSVIVLIGSVWLGWYLLMAFVPTSVAGLDNRSCDSSVTIEGIVSAIDDPAEHRYHLIGDARNYGLKDEAGRTVAVFLREGQLFPVVGQAVSIRGAIQCRRAGVTDYRTILEFSRKPRSN